VPDAGAPGPLRGVKRERERASADEAGAGAGAGADTRVGEGAVAAAGSGPDVTTAAGVVAFARSGSGALAGSAAVLTEPPSFTITDLLDGSNLKSCGDFNSSTIRVIDGFVENKPARTPFNSP